MNKPIDCPHLDKHLMSKQSTKVLSIDSNHAIYISQMAAFSFLLIDISYTLWHFFPNHHYHSLFNHSTRSYNWYKRTGKSSKNCQTEYLHVRQSQLWTDRDIFIDYALHEQCWKYAHKTVQYEWQCMPRYVVWSVLGKINPAVCSRWYTSGSLCLLALLKHFRSKAHKYMGNYCVLSVDGSTGAPNSWGQQCSSNVSPHSWNLSTCPALKTVNIWS